MLRYYAISEPRYESTIRFNFIRLSFSLNFLRGLMNPNEALAGLRAPHTYSQIKVVIISFPFFFLYLRDFLPDFLPDFLTRFFTNGDTEVQLKFNTLNMCTGGRGARTRTRVCPRILSLLVLPDEAVEDKGNEEEEERRGRGRGGRGSQWLTFGSEKYAVNLCGLFMP
jgi:hypothetical protein